MARKSKRLKEIGSFLEKGKMYQISDAVLLLKKLPPIKFDQTIDLAFKLGVDPRKSDQNVRGVVSLPNGTGKKVVVLVFAKGDKVNEAISAGADYAGMEEYFDKVKGGWVDFDAVVCTPDLMREVGKLGKILGPRNLMPTPRVGTVTDDIASIVPKLKAGQIDFKVDRNGVVSVGVGKLSFSNEQIIQNIAAFFSVLSKSKPSTSKGVFIQKAYISSTMGPGLSLDVRDLEMNLGVN